jgi:pSer/pThr/pTyr-binding forkhead associated (FHA) protein
VIILSLLHPLKSVPIQQWTFKENSVIKIGRANSNNVVLYSAVVSRHHLEIRSKGSDWILINKGSNGTFVKDKKIKQILAQDGMIFRLASSGPKIKIKLYNNDDEENKENIVVRKEHKEQPTNLINKKDISKETVMN